MFTFEWDAEEAASNLRKHRVSFDEAVTVFGDPCAVTYIDTDHSENEERSRTCDISRKGRLLVVVHTERPDTVRIISATKAKRHEQSIYTEG